MSWPKGRPRSESTKQKTAVSVTLAYAEGRHSSPKGKGKVYTEPYYVRVEKGLPIFCKVHGEHTQWRKHGNGIGDICCIPCSNARSMAYHYANRFAMLAYQVKRRFPLTDITEGFLNELLSRQCGKCALTGRLFTDSELPTIDRIEPKLGYIKPNVQLVIRKANVMKSDLRLDDFVRYCHLVSVHTTPEYGMDGC